MIQARGLGWTYSGATRAALEDLDLSLQAGQVISLIGPNGSGKSTLLKLLCGILPLRSSVGSVHCQGEDLRTIAPDARARLIAYVPAELSIDFPLTAWEAVSLGRSTRSQSLLALPTAEDRQAIEGAMRACDCWELRARALHSLSGGERQLVSLARAIAQGARVLLLDEALSYMDLHHQAAAGSLVRGLASRGYGVLLVSHDLNLATEWADQVLALRLGRSVAFGSVHEVVCERVLQGLYPGTELRVAPSPASGKPKVFFG